MGIGNTNETDGWDSVQPDEELENTLNLRPTASRDDNVKLIQLPYCTATCVADFQMYLHFGVRAERRVGKGRGSEIAETDPPNVERQGVRSGQRSRPLACATFARLSLNLLKC